MFACERARFVSLASKEGGAMSHRLRIDKLRTAARRKGDRSGYAIAKRTGLHESTISRILRGQAQPGAKALLLFRTAYGCDVDELLDEAA